MHEDVQLLREFVEHRSDAAFRALVERHAGMVHGSALRMVRDAAMAEEVAQAVFILLARKAAGFRSGIVLAGWLHQTTRFVAREALRAELRRQQHHQDFAQMNEIAESSAAPDWDRIAPHLDDALHRLGGTDRDAVVLRFLEGRSFAEIATSLGTSEAAVKMRISRALEKIRQTLGRRGATVSVGVLLTALSTHGASAAPVALAGQIAGVTLATATHGPQILSLVNQTLKNMTLKKLKCILVAAVIALLVYGGSVLLHRHMRHAAVYRIGPPVVRSFEALAGEWVGTGSEIILRRKDA